MCSFLGWLIYFLLPPVGHQLHKNSPHLPSSLQHHQLSKQNWLRGVTQQPLTERYWTESNDWRIVRPCGLFFFSQEIVTALEFGTSVPFGPPFYRWRASTEGEWFVWHKVTERNIRVPVQPLLLPRNTWMVRCSLADQSIDEESAESEAVKGTPEVVLCLFVWF